jgi:hypothetical protein
VNQILTECEWMIVFRGAVSFPPDNSKKRADCVPRPKCTRLQ